MKTNSGFSWEEYQDLSVPPHAPEYQAQVQDFQAPEWQQDRPSWPIPTVAPSYPQGEGYAMGPDPWMIQPCHGERHVATSGPRMNQPPPEYPRTSMLSQLLQDPIMKPSAQQVHQPSQYQPPQRQEPVAAPPPVNPVLAVVRPSFPMVQPVTAQLINAPLDTAQLGPSGVTLHRVTSSGLPQQRV